jgi:hypothetical protein
MTTLSLPKTALPIILVILLILTGCNKTKEYEETIRDLETKVSTIKAEKEDLLKQIDQHKFENRLDINQIVVNKTDMRYLIDYTLRFFPDEFFTFFYDEEYYVPISFLTRELGKDLRISNDVIFINHQGIPKEGIKRTDSFLNSTFTRSDFQNIAGRPLTSEEYVDECTGVHMVTDYYDGITVYYGKNEDVVVFWFEMDKPIFATHRGITIGSKVEELEDAYGTGDKIRNIIYYGEKHAFIGFEIEDGKVKKITASFDGGC